MSTRARWRWSGLVLLVLGLPWGVYYLLFHIAEPDSSGGQWLLPALSLSLVVLTLGLAGVLIRNLVKLIVERRRGILGAKLRSKLVFFFLAFVLLPAIVLFSGSVQVIKTTVEAILRTPAEHLRRGDEIVERWREYFRNESRREAGSLAEQIGRVDTRDPRAAGELAVMIEDHLRARERGMVRVVSGGRRLAGSESPLDPEIQVQMDRRLEELIAEAAPQGKALDRLERLEGGLMAEAVVPVTPREAAGEPVLVAVAVQLPPGIAQSLASIAAAVESYEQFRYKRRDLVRLYVTLIGLIFLATLFVATWIGWYVARRITEPIQEVAAATREISAGNMDVRVKTRVGDEMGVLVDAFNEMAAELQENREVITRSTAELRRSNQALEDRRRYIETLVANLSTGIISLDPAGRITTANPAVEKLLGVRLGPGESARHTLARHGLEPLAEFIEQSRESGGERLRRDVELPESSPTMHVTVQSTPLKGRASTDTDLGSLIMIEDLSDLLRAQKAAAWQEVARRIAHEIKNPLTPIQLAAQRLRKKFRAGADDLDQVLLEATDSIEREVGGLKDLVNEFSRFARMPQVEPKPVELSKIVESVLSLYKGLPGVEWRVEHDPNIGRIPLDAQQMRRALINLIDNAVAAIEERGTIGISSRVVGSDGTVRLEISDSGPGIPAADRDKMFVPYFSTKRRGTGLGLAIVHKIVTDHRGSIRVEDNTPHGARFVIDIPGA